MDKPHKVAVVVDPIFGERLRDLSKRLHVWICAAKVNVEIAQEIYSKTGNEHSWESGVTTFKFMESDSSEEIFLGIIDTVDLHHGEFSHVPPWSVVEVYGTKLTPAIKSKLTLFGEGSFEEIETGFVFLRKSKAL